MIAVARNGIIYPMSKGIIQVENLNVHAMFLHSTETIVEGVSFCLDGGESLAIVGESGSGKSMIVNALTSSLADNCFATGKVEYDGVNLLENRRYAKKLMGNEIVLIPQGGAESLNPSLKIKTQIYESLKRNGVKLTREQKREAAIRNLEKSGLKNAEEILEKYPFEISGGEAQRVVLAITLCSHANLIVADEATRGIDGETKEAFWDCIRNDFSSCATVFVTHDIAEAKRCDDVLVLKDGKVAEYGKTLDVFSNPQSEYTKTLVAVCEVQDA